ncbi:MAG: MerR family transcriptional regulator [Oscillospiraceae bacterium]|nr:MerR family transcriptional regulator [Oscillospiraceae bacterium]
MKTVTEISKMTGVSVRTLHHYDAIGLLKPTDTTEAGYRLYDEDALMQLYLIIVYRELGFSLKKIAALLDAPDFDRNRALEEQISLLEEKKQQIQNRIYFAHGLKLTGVKYLNYEGFDYKKFDDYSAQAKAMWGNTGAYGEFVQKSRGRTAEETQALGNDMMALFTKVGQLRHLEPGSEEVQNWVAQLQSFITEHYYNCTKPMLTVLGEMYAGGGSMTENIDKAGGNGTGEFAKKAIDIYCTE